MIEAIDLTKTYAEGGRRHVVLDRLQLSLAAGDSVALLGRSGSGKSTLLNLMSGIDSADSGDVRFEGIGMRGLTDEARTLLRRRRMGFVFQFFNLLPTLDVLDNVMLPQSLVGTPGRAARSHAMALLQQIGLGDRAGAYPDRLSGGEQQRVALARAIAHRPSLVLADEPTGNLDADTGEEILGLLTELVLHAGTALLMATHSLDAAGRCARVLRLQGGRLEPAAEFDGP